MTHGCIILKWFVEKSKLFRDLIQKQAQVNSEERKFLGIGETNTWSARFMESVQSTVVAKLLNGVAFDFDEFVLLLLLISLFNSLVF